jgi:hypothetical protein
VESVSPHHDANKECSEPRVSIGQVDHHVESVTVPIIT